MLSLRLGASQSGIFKFRVIVVHLFTCLLARSRSVKFIDLAMNQHRNERMVFVC
jgi:hypothetical protein